MQGILTAMYILYSRRILTWLASYSQLKKGASQIKVEREMVEEFLYPDGMAAMPQQRGKYKMVCMIRVSQACDKYDLLIST